MTTSHHITVHPEIKNQEYQMYDYHISHKKKNEDMLPQPEFLKAEEAFVKDELLEIEDEE